MVSPKLMPLGVSSSQNPYPYSFFELIREDTERSFIEDGRMYFCLGTFDAETKEFSLIEVGKEYEINN